MVGVLHSSLYHDTNCHGTASSATVLRIKSRDQRLTVKLCSILVCYILLHFIETYCNLQNHSYNSRLIVLINLASSFFLFWLHSVVTVDTSKLLCIESSKNKFSNVDHLLVKVKQTQLYAVCHCTHDGKQMRICNSFSRIFRVPIAAVECLRVIL